MWSRLLAMKQPPEPKLTDEERHARFVEMAKKLGASEKPADFNNAFKRVTGAPRGN